MNTARNSHTVTSLVAEACEILESAGFRAVMPSKIGTWKATEVRVYEDVYSIVCIAVYETWATLASQWRDDQASLVELISRHFTRIEAKAWDGYLVLLTPSAVPATERQEAVDIRRNIIHVRKLLATGEELGSTSVVRRTLLPLLPLDSLDIQRANNVLDTLPPILAGHGIDEEAVKAAVDAFLEQRPIIDAINRYTMKNRQN